MNPNTEITKLSKTKKALWVIVLTLSVANFFVYFLGSGLGGNYTGYIDSITHWTIPIGSFMWGFLLAIPLNLIPYVKLNYKRRYILTALGLTIGFSIMFLIIGITL